jgi:dolichyl-phosphate-mannose-protein mannosyltransferase
MSSAVRVRRARHAAREAPGLPTAPVTIRRHADPTATLRWAGPLGVVLVAAVARFWALGVPGALVFDETYYVKDAWTLWHLGYEGTWKTDPDRLFNAGKVNGFTNAAEFVAHPPLGKWLIGIGEVLTGGGNTAGWRLAVAVAGVLAVALLMLVAHRLFANPFVTTVAGGILAIDNQAILLSRVTLLDNFVMLFALAGFACILEDRFWTERRFGAWLMRRSGPPGDWGPALVWRPWLLAAATAFGLCAGVKWSGLYFLLAFVAYSIGVDALLRRRAGVRHWLRASAIKQLPATLLTTIPVAVVAYLLCWTGWFLTSGGWGRRFVENGGARFPGVLGLIPTPLQDLWQWHQNIYAFHVGLDKSHPYASPAIFWPIMLRPTSMYYVSSGPGQRGCRFDSCSEALTDLANPLLWYAFWAAAIYLVWRLIRRREWQTGLVLTGIVAGWLPWVVLPSRTMFFFYSIAFEPYLVLCLAATIGLMVVRPPLADAADELTALEARRTLKIRRVVVGVYLGAAVLVSAFFYPLDDGMQVPYWFWHIHMWSTTWI